MMETRSIFNVIICDYRIHKNTSQSNSLLMANISIIKYPPENWKVNVLQISIKNWEVKISERKLKSYDHGNVFRRLIDILLDRKEDRLEDEAFIVGWRKLAKMIECVKLTCNVDCANRLCKLANWLYKLTVHNLSICFLMRLAKKKDSSFRH